MQDKVLTQFTPLMQLISFSSQFSLKKLRKASFSFFPAFPFPIRAKTLLFTSLCTPLLLLLHRSPALILGIENHVGVTIDNCANWGG